MASRSYPPNGIRCAKAPFIDDAPGSHVGLPEGLYTLPPEFQQDMACQPCAGYTKLTNVGISRSLPCGRLHTPDSAGRQGATSTDPDANHCQHPVQEKLQRSRGML